VAGHRQALLVLFVMVVGPAWVGVVIVGLS